MKKLAFILIILSFVFLYDLSSPEVVVKTKQKEISLSNLKELTLENEIVDLPTLNEESHKIRGLGHRDDILDFIAEIEEKINKEELMRKLKSNIATKEEQELFRSYLQIKLEGQQILIDTELASIEQEYL